MNTKEHRLPPSPTQLYVTGNWNYRYLQDLSSSRAKHLKIPGQKKNKKLVAYFSVHYSTTMLLLRRHALAGCFYVTIYS